MKCDPYNNYPMITCCRCRRAYQPVMYAISCLSIQHRPRKSSELSGFLKDFLKRKTIVISLVETTAENKPLPKVYASQSNVVLTGCYYQSIQPCILAHIQIAHDNFLSTYIQVTRIEWVFIVTVICSQKYILANVESDLNCYERCRERLSSKVSYVLYSLLPVEN